jgi:hypothetical protein
MLKPLVDWYHKVTVHVCGMDKLEALIRRHFFHPNIRAAVRECINNCDVCPKVRSGAPPRGHLAPRNAPILPWHEVHVDFIGPWKVKVNKQSMLYNALTCIEPVTNLIEIVRLRGPKTAENARFHFENNYLCRYPRPLGIVHDNGPEFIGHDFQFALEHAGIKSINISPHTPTANAVIESSHKAIGQVIRTLLHLKPPTSSAAADALIDEALATAMYVLRSTPNQSLGNYSPGALVFNRDMLLDIPLRADLVALTRHRQAQIDNRLLRVNAKRISH